MSRINSRHRRSFTLLLALFLLALLAASGSGLALLTAVENLRSDWAAHELDHRLAAESLLNLLPALLERQSHSRQRQRQGSSRRRVELSFGHFQVVAAVTDESEKAYIDSESDLSAVRAKLRSIANSHGLNAEAIREHDGYAAAKDEGDPGLVWFDQILVTTSVEDVFPWVDATPDDRGRSVRETWSDHITFFDDAAYSAVIHSRIGTDTRRWYGVINVDDGKVDIVFLTRI